MRTRQEAGQGKPRTSGKTLSTARNLSNLEYGKELVESGLEGASEARRAVLRPRKPPTFFPLPQKKSWQAASFGVLVGAVVGALVDDLRPVRGVIAGGILGALMGYGGSFAWQTRPLTWPWPIRREGGYRQHARSPLAGSPAINYG